MFVGFFIKSTPFHPLIIMAPNTASSSSIACGCNFFKANNSRFIYLDWVYIFEIFHAKVR
jgi:hypothetical protein